MKTPSRFSLVAVALAAVVWLPPAGASAPRGGALEPDKLVILSTTDVKGKVDPCG